jgi:hypothetical protein
MEDTVPAQTVTARRIIKGDNKWSNKMWMYARVVEVNPSTGRLVVQRRAIDTNRFHGYIFKQSTSGVHLDATANNRMNIVTDWATGADGDGRYTLVIDESCDIVLNGLYMNDVSTLVSGDVAGVEYTYNQRGAMTLYPDTVRASRLEATRTNGLDSAYLAMPPAVTAAWGASTVTLNGTVVIDGATGAAGPATGVVTQIGYGPSGTPPSTGTWTWVSATHAGAGMESDWYAISVTPSVTGVYDVALRVQLPGEEWTYADRDGAWNGYSSAATGKLVSQVPEPATAALALAIAALVTVRSGTFHTPDVAPGDSGLGNSQ